MKTICVILACLALAGCGRILMRLPSVENCQHVTYQRDYNHVQLTADCKIGE